VYDAILEKVMAGQANVENDLRDANSLSLLYADLARVHRAAGALDKAEAIEARRVALWTRWREKLPNNPFVRRQLAPTTR
jgi:hypothetical protein